MNQAILSGEIVRVREFNTGEHKLKAFTLKTVQQFKDREKVDYVPCKAWNKDISLQDGMTILVRGTIGQSKREKEGKTIYETEVTVQEINVII